MYLIPLPNPASTFNDVLKQITLPRDHPYVTVTNDHQADLQHPLQGSVATLNVTPDEEGNAITATFLGATHPLGRQLFDRASAQFTLNIQKDTLDQLIRHLRETPGKPRDLLWELTQQAARAHQFEPRHWYPEPAEGQIDGLLYHPAYQRTPGGTPEPTLVGVNAGYATQALQLGTHVIPAETYFIHSGSTVLSTYRYGNTGWEWSHHQPGDTQPGSSPDAPPADAPQSNATPADTSPEPSQPDASQPAPENRPKTAGFFRPRIEPSS